MKNRYRFWFNCGWFSGEDFTLFAIEIYGKSEWDLITIFEIKVGKFIIGLGIAKN
jgi:hypothetical protein